MEPAEWDHRLAFVLVAGRIIPGDEERRAWDEAVRRTPNAILPQPYDQVFSWAVRRLADDDPLADDAVVNPSRSSRLLEVIWRARQGLTIALIRELAGERVPLDGRIAALLGVDVEPRRRELAAAMAREFAMPAPEGDAATQVLVNLAIDLHHYVDRPPRMPPHEDMSFLAIEDELSVFGPEALDRIAEDLGLAPEPHVRAFDTLLEALLEPTERLAVRLMRP
jgi:hypothetical protein